MARCRAPGSASTKRAWRTLAALAADGLDSYYRGALAERIAADLAAYRAKRTTPLHLAHSAGDLYNMTPSTQGAVSLAILGLLDRVDLRDVTADSADHIHLVVETTKRAFIPCDSYITDPLYIEIDGQVSA